MRRHDGASSDGYLAHVFRHAAKQLFDEDVGEVTYRTLRSACVVSAAVQGKLPKASQACVCVCACVCELGWGLS